MELAPASPAATRLAESLRMFDRQAIADQVTRNPAVVNERGPSGSTPLMYAALYGDASLVAEMLKVGGDPNIRNHAGASALMWAVGDIDKVRSLVDRGADVNATSSFGRTPLLLASSQAGAAPVVKLLLDHGAAATPAALTVATVAGDVAVVRLLLAAGVRDSGVAATAAVRSGCRECLDAILSEQELPRMPGAVLGILPPVSPGDRPEALSFAIDRGGDVNAKDGKLRTALMLAAMSETIAPESVTLLLDRGADVNAKSPEGRSALFFANRVGRAFIVDLLTKAGATTEREPEPSLTFVKQNSVRDAVQRSLPLLQRTAQQFYKKSGCLSCHHNTLTAMTVALARPKGFAVDESLAREDFTTIVKDIDDTREQALQGIVTPGGFVTTTGYLLMALSAESHRPDAATDAMVRLLKLSQRSDGRWQTGYRPPSEASEATATAVSLRGVQLYGRRQGKPSDDDVIRSAASWLERVSPQSNEDRVFRLFGLTWARASEDVIQAAIRDLLSAQREDGGWAQLPSLRSDAYATGSALVALHEAGVRPADPAYRRGARFLLTTQLADGSWFVRTRSHPTQVHFDSGFPHGEHQFISAAATNWATQALVHADERDRSR